MTAKRLIIKAYQMANVNRFFKKIYEIIYKLLKTPVYYYMLCYAHVLFF